VIAVFNSAEKTFIAHALFDILKSRSGAFVHKNITNNYRERVGANPPKLVNTNLNSYSHQ